MYFIYFKHVLIVGVWNCCIWPLDNRKSGSIVGERRGYRKHPHSTDWLIVRRLEMDSGWTMKARSGPILWRHSKDNSGDGLEGGPCTFHSPWRNSWLNKYIYSTQNWNFNNFGLSRMSVEAPGTVFVWLREIQPIGRQHHKKYTQKIVWSQFHVQCETKLMLFFRC